MRNFAPIKRIAGDTAGNVLVEATVMMSIILIFILGGIDFLFAFYQYNAAAKAVEMGARIAAVWDPVASGLNALSTNAVNSSGYTAGGPMPSFTVTCDGSLSTPSCTCNTGGYCSGVTYSANAMAAIVCGRGATSVTCTNAGACPASTSLYTTGMCQMFAGIRPRNVKVVYTQTGLGYAGRPGGPVPTITVSIVNVPFTYYFLGGLLQFSNVTMPPLTTSITGEYLSSSPAS
jgi:Flp pilus assembly protein TadG